MYINKSFLLLSVGNLGLVTALLYPCGVIAVMKIIISFLQLYAAMANVASIDVAERVAVKANSADQKKTS